VFGSVVRWMLAALHSCYVLLVDLCWTTDERGPIRAEGSAGTHSTLRR
jgi:hypothetical protein